MYIVEFEDRGIILKDVNSVLIDRQGFDEAVTVTLKDGDKLAFELRLGEKVHVHEKHEVQINPLFPEFKTGEPVDVAELGKAILELVRTHGV